MKIFTVGGYVRDTLLGLQPKDRDYVVVNSSSKEMVDLGYQQVGESFPVFLDSDGTEFALARKERKTGPGYAGFEFDTESVTLEEDLSRRDFTVNSMAMDVDGSIIDPFGGQADLKRKIIRHTGPAFVEDPVRCLRACRFAARYDWSIAPETKKLIREMCTSGEVDHLVAERVWQELYKSASEGKMYEFLKHLFDVGAYEKLFPYLTPWVASHSSHVLSGDPLEDFCAWILETTDRSDCVYFDLPTQRLSALQRLDKFQAQYKSPTMFYKSAVATLASTECNDELTSDQLLMMYTTIGAFRADGVFEVVSKFKPKLINQKLRVQLLNISVSDLLHLPGKQIGALLSERRVQCITDFMKSSL